MRALPACSVRRSELVPCGHLVRAAGDDRIQAMEHSWKRRSRIAPKGYVPRVGVGAGRTELR
jgi:hypothetical protein